MMRRLFSLLSCVMLLYSTAPQSLAQPEAFLDVTPPRLSLVDGAVSFWRPGAEEWTPARLNVPLAEGDEIYTTSANCELQVGPQAYIRAGRETELGISSIEPDFLQVRLPAGESVVDARELLPGHTIEVDTPRAAFIIKRPGYYRIDVEPELTSFIVRREGAGIATFEEEEPVEVYTGEELVLSDTQPPVLDAAPELDRWDHWNESRTEALFDTLSARYVSPRMYGLHELDSYGRWRDIDAYGPVWIPRDTPPGWAPYTTGRWIWDPEYEWTWVDDAPWGWAPFHYGRWVFIDGMWGWAPGPVIEAPAYAPALVGFLVSGPDVSWVPLSWGEPVIPWWGPSSFRGAPWWGGWRGPRIVNDTIINERTEVNINQIVYHNTRVTKTVAATPTEEFGRGRAHFVQLPSTEVHPVRAPEHMLPTRPSPASLAPNMRRAPSPPPEMRNRPVIATRPPQTPKIVRSELAKQTSISLLPQPRLVPSPSPAQLNAFARSPANKGREQSSLLPRFTAPQQPQLPSRSANFPRSEVAPPTPSVPPEPRGAMRMSPSHETPRQEPFPLPAQASRPQPSLPSRLPPSATRGSVPPHGISRTTPPQPGQRVAPHQSPEEAFRRQPFPPTERRPAPLPSQHETPRVTPPQPRVVPQRSPEETFRSQSLPSSHIPLTRTREESMRMLQQRNMTMGERLQREQRAEAHRPLQQRPVPGVAPLQQPPRTSELHRPEPPFARETPASAHKQASTHPTVPRQE